MPYTVLGEMTEHNPVMTTEPCTTAWCVEVADSERPQLEAAFAAHPELDGRLLPGTLEGHLDDLATAAVVSVFIESRVGAVELDRLPKLELLVTRSTGFDHIDLAACAARGITVANVPSYGENTVAEHTFALLLALSRRLLFAIEHGRRGRLDRTGLQGTDLKGKTVGVIATGRIGLHFIRMARAFGMEVLAFDPRPNELLADVMQFTYVPLEELLRRSDVISLHAPSTPATRHLINADTLALVKPGAILLNTARGDLIDTEALVDALNAGRLAGAGLDVLEGEQDVDEDHHLLADGGVDDLKLALTRRLLAERDDVIVTPHNAFNSHEAVQRIADTTVAAIAAHHAGAEIETVVGV